VPSVFLSYSHKDEDWKKRLRTHLGVLESQGLLDVWDDRRIEGGDGTGSPESPHPLPEVRARTPAVGGGDRRGALSRKGSALTSRCLPSRSAGLAPTETWGRCTPRSLCGRMEPTKALPEEDQAGLSSDLAIAARSCVTSHDIESP